MPTYEYACTSCAHEWEFEQSIKEAALTECPACHNATARRQISRGTGFILKGSGWYSDLYSSSSNKPPAKADGGSGDGGKGSGTDGGSGGKSDGGSGGASGSAPSTPSSTPTSSAKSESGSSSAAA